MARINLPDCRTENYWVLIRRLAETYHFDGCTGVPDFYINACLEHDGHYRFHATIFNKPITRAQADQRFREVIQCCSPWATYSPMSWWRWLGVRLLGGPAWDHSYARTTGKIT